ARQPFQRGRRLVGGTQRGAQALVGLRQGGAALGQCFDGCLFARLGLFLRGGRALHLGLAAAMASSRLSRISRSAAAAP
ncbi:hypothetical protein, partial [Sphingobium sp. C100]|uniref:hypothetical protein n=1 Tax=Sphingobium sp. C100 TaxID=1207055 RepID=UPI00190F107C